MMRRRLSRRLRTGFTLVELLVGIAVLVIMLFCLASMMVTVANLWLGTLNTVDNFTKARTMLNLLDRDIQMMVLRRDLAVFTDGSGNPACAFYTGVQGYPGSDARTLSLVRYALTTSSSSSTLLRLSYGMGFTTGTVPTTGNTSSLPQLSAASVQTETLATGVIAFQWQFVDGTGTLQTPSTSTPFLYNLNTPGASGNARAIIVSMVVLGNTAYTRAIQNGQISTLTDGSSIFSTTAPVNQTFSQVWSSTLNSASDSRHASFLSLSESVRGGIEVYQRYIPLPIATPSS